MNILELRKLLLATLLAFAAVIMLPACSSTEEAPPPEDGSTAAVIVPTTATTMMDMARRRDVTVSCFNFRTTTNLVTRQAHRAATQCCSISIIIRNEWQVYWT